MRVLPEETPVDQVVVGGIAPARGIVVGGRGLFLAPPGAVPVPDETRMEDVTQGSRLDDALVGGLVDRVVEALIADLEELAGLLGRVDHAAAAGAVPGHHLLAQDVLAGLERADRHLGVQPQRHREDDGLEVLLLDHRLPVLVVRGLRHPRLGHHLVGFLEVSRVDVADGLHVRVGGIGRAEEHPALAAQADVADAHGPAAHGALDRSRRGQGRHRRGGGHGLQEVAAAQLLLLRSEIHDAKASVVCRTGPRLRKRSRPAIRPVRKLRTTSTAAASIRFLFTIR